MTCLFLPESETALAAELERFKWRAMGVYAEISTRDERDAAKAEEDRLMEEWHVKYQKPRQWEQTEGKAIYDVKERELAKRDANWLSSIFSR
jgi:hypothetical protein